MKFHFSYEKLLEHRKTLEEVARRDYNEAVGILEQELNRRSDMEKKVEESLEMRFQIQVQSSGADVGKLSEIHDYLEGQSVRIQNQEKVIANHVLIVDQKREILVAAAKETKVLEKLKEKQLQEFRKQERKRDAKHTDELVVTRFRRGESA